MENAFSRELQTLHLLSILAVIVGLRQQFHLVDLKEKLSKKTRTATSIMFRTVNIYKCIFS